MPITMIPLEIEKHTDREWKKITRKRAFPHERYRLKFATGYCLEVDEPKLDTIAQEHFTTWYLYKDSSVLASDIIIAKTESELFDIAIEKSHKWLMNAAKMWSDLADALNEHRNDITQENTTNN